MTKTLSLPDAVYRDVELISKELTSVAKKPISIPMTVYLLTEVYYAHLRDPCARDLFRQRLTTSDIMSPEEFESAEDPQKEK